MLALQGRRSHVDLGRDVADDDVVAAYIWVQNVGVLKTLSLSSHSTALSSRCVHFGRDTGEEGEGLSPPGHELVRVGKADTACSASDDDSKLLRHGHGTEAVRDGTFDGESLWSQMRARQAEHSTYKTCRLSMLHAQNGIIPNFRAKRKELHVIASWPTATALRPPLPLNPKLILSDTQTNSNPLRVTIEALKPAGPQHGSINSFLIRLYY